MKAAITVSVPAEMALAEEQKVQLSGLVEVKLEESKTLAMISTDEQFMTAGVQLKVIAQLRERISGTLKPYIEFWHKGHKAHTELLATLDGPLEARERSMKQGLARYQREKEEARRREEERLRREAEELRRKLEEEERKRRELETAAARRRLEDEALAETASRAAAGDQETAELILERAVQQTEVVPQGLLHVPAMVLAPIMPATTPKVRGVAFRDVPRWRMECGHERGDDPNCPTCQSMPREYLILDTKRVQARVNAFGVNANIPGIEVWMEYATSVRRKS
jgi:hypothetical protein